MSVINQQIKSQLAKLLATEDLMVEHRRVETAQFNVQTRVLTLPMWEKASNDVYDLLVAHEVGHALYTPNEDWREKVNIPGQFVNIVEDVRIEKLIKRRYAGLPKTFFRGYKELSDDDFFGIVDEDVNAMNLADRVNIFFKIGLFVNVQFTDEEQEIVDLIGKSETFDEALHAAKVLYEYCAKDKQQEEVPAQSDEQTSGSAGSGEKSENADNQQSDTEEDGESDGDPKSGESDDQTGSMNNQPQPSNEGGDHNTKVKTDDILQEKLRDLVDQNGSNPVYLQTPQVNLDSVVVSNKEYHQFVFSDYIGLQSSEDVFSDWDRDYRAFKKEAQKEVNYLVKEFECRKSADAYARASVSKTGVLNTRALHTYKYNEDLFKKVTTFPDGKNHGLVFVMDWSGSMEDYLMDTVKQLFTLIWFCKKVAIPFDVYLFTNCYARVTYDHYGRASFPKTHHGMKLHELYVSDSFSLMNALTNGVSASVLETQMKNFWRVATATTRRYSYGVTGLPARIDLSGTPLSESIIALHQIIPDFQKRNKVQKVQTVILTDGDGASIQYIDERNYSKDDSDDKDKLFRRTLAYAAYGTEICLRNRRSGKVYKMTDHVDISKYLIQELRDCFPQVNIIGIRILSNRELNKFIREGVAYGDLHECDKLCKEFKKQHSVAMKTNYYHRYFGISSNHVNVSDDFEVQEGATKAQIKSSFMKSLRSKKMNKKILSEFIELVA